MGGAEERNKLYYISFLDSQYMEQKLIPSNNWRAETSDYQARPTTGNDNLGIKQTKDNRANREPQ